MTQTINSLPLDRIYFLFRQLNRFTIQHTVNLLAHIVYSQYINTYSTIIENHSIQNAT